SSYVLDISTNPQFTGLVAGSSFNLDSLTYSRNITGLISGTYYYRVRSQTAGISNQESVSETMSVLLNYSPPGNALSMDGSNDLLSIDNATGINNRFADSKITVETWFLLKALPNAGQMPALVTENYNGAGGYNILFSIFLHQNKIWGGFHDGNWTAASAQYSFDINKWYHVAATYDKTIIKLYVNGTLIATKSTTQTLPKGSEDWSIGRRWDYNEFINGNFDEVKIYNAALTEEQINLDMRDTGVVIPNKIVAYYNFDQGVAAANNTHITTIFDKSPSAYHANLSNSALTGTTSNLIESYAIAVPKALAATDVNPTGFTANWEVSKIGEVNNYLLEVSTTKDFTGLIASAYVLSNTATSRVFNTLIGGTYYYRVRANNTKANIIQQGGYSRVIQVDVPYTPPGNAMAFDGINDQLKLDNATIGNFGTSNWTVEFWMKTSAAKTLQIISKRETCGDGHFWNIGMSASGTLFYELDNASRTQLMQINTDPNTKVNDGRWHHVAWVREGINVKVYIDGVVRANNNSNGVISQGVGNSIDIGALYCYPGNYQGSLDEIRIWYNARTSEQINAAMKAPIDPNAIGLKLYLDFDNGVGGAQNYDQTYVIDKSVSKANARIYNMELEALNTNFVQSYAMVVPTQLEPTEITPNGFKLNWTAPSTGVVSNYFVDISLSSNFTAPISGSPFNVSGGQTSFTVDGLAPSTFYCRIRANQSGKPYSSEGAPSNVKIVKLEYTPPGNALKFDGTNDYATIPRPISGDFTIEYWMKTNQVGYSGHITGTGVVDMEIGGAPGDYRNALVGDKITFGLGSNGQDPTLYSNTSVNNGKWYHIAMTREKSTGQIRLYVNGNLEANGNSGT
ncbi:MAG: LamG-like jellyroll fold domain-containing protein, partial [Bacteroidia bacterium]